MSVEKADNQQNSETLKADLLRLVKILEGKLEGNYRSYPCDMIDKAIIYAEFDLVYHYEHIQIANGRYLRKDPNTGKEEWLSQDQYFTYIKSLITSDDDYKSRQNSRLKNKVDNTFSLLYHIIDGSNFSDMSYEEFQGEMFFKVKDRNRKKMIIPEIKLKRDSVIEKKTIGKASTRRVIYIYKKNMAPFINLHFKAKSHGVSFTLLNRIERITDGDVDHKTEIIEALTNSRNLDNIAKIREIEKEIDNTYLEAPSSYDDAILRKYKIAIKLALQLSDPDEVAILYVKYLDFISSLSKSSIDGAFLTEHSTSNSRLQKECLDIIIQHSSKSFEELKNVSKKNGKEFGPQMKSGFESQIRLLRLAKSSTLPDVLFTYGAFCVSIFDFETAEKCFIECRDIYVKLNEARFSIDLVIIYSNLCKLYCEWKRVEVAIEYGELAIKYLKRCEVFAYNSSLNIHYAILYNLVSISYQLRNEFDRADECNKKATQHIQKEDDSDTKVFYLQLMIAYNYATLRIFQGDYHGAYVGLDMLYWKTMLLCKIDDSLDNIDLKGLYENALARCEMNLNNFDEAKFYAEEGIKTYDNLCEKNYARYAMSRLYLLQTLADIYEAEDLNEDAEKQYLAAIAEAEHLFNSGVYVVKGRLHEIITHLAGLYNKIGNYELAIQRCIEVLDICDELLLLDENYYKLEIVKGLNNLAIAHYNIGDLMAALEDNQNALDICKELHESEYNQETIEYWTSKIKRDLSIMVNG